MSNKKMGRPTDELKPNKLNVRLSDKDLRHLDEYCKKNNKSRPDGIREAIKALKI